MTVALTVCIPTYNGARHLSEALRSVASQTFRDFEVLVVDDCSTDDTLLIAESYRDVLPTLRVIRNPSNLGLVRNWNACIDHSRGEWIKYLFQDDLIDTNCLDAMMARAHRPLVFCKRRFLFAPEADPRIISKYKAIPSLRDACGPQEEIPAQTIAAAVLKDPRNFFGEPTAALIHRSLFTRFGYFNPDFRQICDLEYWIRVATNVGLSSIDEVLATFRYHGSSTSAKNHSPAVLERIELLDDLLLLHEFAYHEHYGNVRAAGRESLPRRNFKVELANKAHWIRLRAAAHARSPSDSDRLWLDDWQRVAVRYPHLDDPVRQAPHRARDFWRRHIGWRRFV